MTKKAHVLSQIVYYLGWLMMFFIETTLWSITGLVLGFVAFSVGGTLWAAWSIKSIDPDRKLHGPILWVTDWLLTRSQVIMLLPASVVAGGPGVGLVLKKQGCKNALLLSGIASVIYAVLWLAIHALRPQVGVPVEVWPSGEFISNLTGLF